MQFLQVKDDLDNWKYVFCYNESVIICTDKKEKSLKGTHALLFFINKFSNKQFRLTK